MKLVDTKTEVKKDMVYSRINTSSLCTDVFKVVYIRAHIFNNVGSNIGREVAELIRCK